MANSVLSVNMNHFGGGAGPGGIAASGPSGVSNGGADSHVKKQVGIMGDIRKNTAEFAKSMGGQPRWWTKALKTMGIQMSLAGILKQSQIFTSTLGSLFQILGAFVDIMLAPWIPIIVPGLRKLANQIPKMRIIAKQFFDWATGPAWKFLQKLYKFLTKDLLDASFWGDLIFKAVRKLYKIAQLWFVGFLDDSWTKLPKWIKGGKDPFGKKLAELQKAMDESNSWAELASSSGPGPGPGSPDGGFFGNLTTMDKVLMTEAGIVIAAGVGKGFKHIPLMNNFFTRPISKLVDTVLGFPLKLEGKLAKGAFTAAVFGVGLATRGKLKRGVPKVVPKVAPRSAFPPTAKELRLKEIQNFRAGGVGIAEDVGQAGASRGSRFMSMLQTGAGKVARSPVVRPGLRFGSKLGVRGIPFLGAAFLAGETTFDLNQMRKSEKGWTGDVGSSKAWLSEGKGHLGSLLGGAEKGSMMEKLSPMHWVGKAAEHLPGIGKDVKNVNEKMDRWKMESAKEGALSGGKSLDMAVRAVSGYVGSLLSLAPIIGQIAGGVLYEAGTVSTTGRFVGMGEGKYGDKDFMEVAGGKLAEGFMNIFRNANVDLKVDNQAGTLHFQTIE